MKLIIQIPCFNEALSLPSVIREIPIAIPGIAEIHTVVIDDGSSDRTSDIAHELEIRHLVRIPNNTGLCRAFVVGLDYCLHHGADFVVNIDGDNQYSGKEIPKLVEPLLRREADIVVGVRNIEGITSFSWVKKKLQRIGSKVVSWIGGVSIPDVTSGFRALTKEAAARLILVDRYTYTLESILQSRYRDLRIHCVEISSNSVARPSRLIRSIPQYLLCSAVTIGRHCANFRLGLILAALWMIWGAVLLFFVRYFFEGYSSSTALGLAFFAVGCTMLAVLLSVIAARLHYVRRLQEECVFLLRSTAMGRADDRDTNSFARETKDP